MGSADQVEFKGDDLPEEPGDQKGEGLGLCGDQGGDELCFLGDQTGPVEVEVAGENVHLIGIQHGADILQVFHSGGCPVLHGDSRGIDACGGEIIVHALGFGEVMFIALAAGDDADGVGVGVQVLNSGIQSLLQHGGGFGAVDSGAQDDEDLAAGLASAVHGSDDGDSADGQNQ